MSFRYRLITQTRYNYALDCRGFLSFQGFGFALGLAVLDHGRTLAECSTSRGPFAGFRVDVWRAA